MSYSSALFDPRDAGDAPRVVRPTVAGRRRRRRKIERLLDQAGVGAGTRVLEIGTGWGELAIRAAAPRRDRALGHPVAASSRRWPRERIAEAGLRRPRRRSSCCDYRAVDGRVRRRRVGRDDRGGRPRVLADVLPRPSTACSPRAARSRIQAITMPHDRMLATRNTYTWINKYIFPGGFLPSVEAIEEVTRDAHHAAGHRPAVVRASTTPRRCGCWDERFLAARERGRARSGFDDVFQPDVALLPGVLPGRLRLGLPRRPADRARRGGIADDHHRPGRAHDRGRAAGVAPRLAAALAPFVGGELPVRLTAWDGSEAGPGRRAARRAPLAATRCAGCCWHPGELGAAQAYVTGELDVEGDLDAALTHVWRGRRASAASSGVRPDAGAARRRCCARPRTLGALGPPPPPPASQARAPRPAAQPAAATGRRSATTTTCPTSSTR